MKTTTLCAAVFVTVSSLAPVAVGQVTANRAAQSLTQKFEGVVIWEHGGRVRKVLGVPMTVGQTAREAAQRWLTEYGAAFTGSQLELREYSHIRLHSGKTAISYRQFMNGVRVDGAMVTVLTSGETPERVVYVGARVGDPPGPWPKSPVTDRQALEVARASDAGKSLDLWSRPEPAVIYFDDGKGAAPSRLVWRVNARSSTILADQTYYVDGASGAVLRTRSNVAPFDVTGTVRAWATPGLEPDTWEETAKECANPPTWDIPLDRLVIEARNGSNQLVDSTTTNEDGEFTLNVANSQAVILKAYLRAEQWRVMEQLGGTDPMYWTDAAVQTTTSTGPASGVPIVFNDDAHTPASQPPPTAEEYRTANINAYYHTMYAHDYLRTRIPWDTVPGVDDEVLVATNGDAPGLDGQAVASPDWIWFSRGPTAGIPYVRNAAHSMVVAHEYAHYALFNIREINYDDDQTAFHEGFADTLSHLAFDQEGIGYNFEACDLIYREPMNPRREYPLCDTSFQKAYEHGMVLSGAWLDVLRNFRTSCSCSSQGLEDTRQLHVDWSVITDGGISSYAACGNIFPGHAAHSGILYEILVADDNDAWLLNGTPHDTEICDAFGEHNVTSMFCGLDRPARPSPGWVDCSHDGLVDVADVLCFQRKLAAGDRGADCNRDGFLTATDFACFQAAWVAAVRTGE